MIKKLQLKKRVRKHKNSWNKLKTALKKTQLNCKSWKRNFRTVKRESNNTNKRPRSSLQKKMLLWKEIVVGRIPLLVVSDPSDPIILTEASVAQAVTTHYQAASQDQTTHTTRTGSDDSNKRFFIFFLNVSLINFSIL